MEMILVTAVIVAVVIALPVVLAVAATVSVVRASAQFGTTEVVWLLLIWLVPVVGAVLWFLVGRRALESARS